MLFDEVRIGRQVSHPNICRLYDIAEVDGLIFITMEFVDGEDLSSLLRRIGRLPHDKAASVARDLCAGLAAAHELGVILLVSPVRLAPVSAMPLCGASHHGRP